MIDAHRSAHSCQLIAIRHPTHPWTSEPPRGPSALRCAARAARRRPGTSSVDRPPRTLGTHPRHTGTGLAAARSPHACGRASIAAPLVRPIPPRALSPLHPRPRRPRLCRSRVAAQSKACALWSSPTVVKPSWRLTPPHPNAHHTRPRSQCLRDNHRSASTRASQWCALGGRGDVRAPAALPECAPRSLAGPTPTPTPTSPHAPREHAQSDVAPCSRGGGWPGHLRLEALTPQSALRRRRPAWAPCGGT